MALVTCATLAAALAAASPGDTLTLQPGSRCENLVVSNRRFPGAPVTIVAEGARISGLRIAGSEGLHWKGGTYVALDGRVGRGPRTYAANVRNSQNIRMEGVTYTEAVRGIVIAGSSNIAIVNNDFVDLRMDGLNLASSRDSLIDNNRFSGFDPIPTRCDLPDGTVKRRVSRRDCLAIKGSWTDGDHSDGIQMWNQPDNIRITNNRVHGHAHGIGQLGPPGDTGTRITIENNFIRVSTPHGITLQNCTDCRVVGNDIAAAEGSRWEPVIRVAGTTGTVCGNTVAGRRGDMAPRQPCRK